MKRKFDRITGRGIGQSVATKPKLPYEEFVRRKAQTTEQRGFDVDLSEIHDALKPHAKVAVQWACRGGSRALFESWGMTKTRQQIEILRLILAKAEIPKSSPLFKTRTLRGLIVCPLGCTHQFLSDAEVLGVPIKFVRSIEECGATGIHITNYETVRDGKLDPAAVITIFSEYLDTHDLRLDVPKDRDCLKSSYDGGYSWCDKCYQAIDEDDDGCRKRGCPLISCRNCGCRMGDSGCTPKRCAERPLEAA